MRAQFAGNFAGANYCAPTVAATIIVHCVRHGGISFRYIGVCPCNKLVTNKVIALGKYVIIKCITEAL